MRRFLLASKDRIKREKAQLKQMREREILEASEALFLKKGFSRTRISDIAHACELTNGAIYLYFKNKNELILIIMTKISNSFADLLLEEDRENETGIVRISRLLNVYNKSFREFPEYHRLDAQFNILFDKKYPGSHHLEKYFAANTRVLDIFISIFKDGVKDGTIDVNPEKTAHMFLNVMNSYVEKLSLRKHLMEEEQGISMENELNELINYLIDSLKV
ncbi:MAG: TetR/AcrR family transcriptional regulator [Spirochaetaceae bacterium]|jgi:TetR/AcrR family fatty acid metabolism transcriptional regulator|nr:TetR/AcrR family transcriptional regulator [Spirochaetaceae bacterium]